MITKPWLRKLVLLLMSLAATRTAVGQWVTQRIPLNPGWNAVHLQVAPAITGCREAFAGLSQIESVWQFNRRYTTVQFDERPDVILKEPDHWLTWLPLSHPEAFLSTLQALQGGQSYLIKVNLRATPFVWEVKGMPIVVPEQWVPNSLNLMGFSVDPQEPPSFAQCFRDTPEVDSAPGAASGIYSLQPDGKDYQVRQTERTLIEPGKAYWVRVRQALRTASPILLEGDFVSDGRIDFGLERKEFATTMQANTPQPIELTLRLLASEPAPAGQPEVAGPVPLAHFVNDTALGQFGWQRLPAALTIILPPGERRELRLAVIRSELQRYSATGTNGAAYQSILELREKPHGLRFLFPVRAESDLVRRVNPQSVGGSGTPAPGGGLGELPSYALSQGLWVGSVRLDQVSRPGYTAGERKEANPLLPVASPMNLRVLLHVNALGQVSLLQRVLLAWSGASTNGQYELYAEEGAVPADRKDVYRISSVGFPLMRARPLQGLFGDALRARVALDANDTVNPFKHAFHPDHDNKDELFSTNLVPAGVESFAVVRDVTFNFSVTHRNADGSYRPESAVLSLDGKQSQIVVDPFTLGGAVTVEAWFKAGPQRSQAPFLFSFSNGTNDNLYLKLDAVTSRMSFGVDTPGNNYVLTTTNAFPTNEWVYVGAVLNGTDEGRIYWNANVVAQGLMRPPNAMSRTNVYFGRGPRAADGYFAGRIYDLVIYGGDRLAEDVRADMFLSVTPNSETEIVYFKANEGTGDRLVDVDGGPVTARLLNIAWDYSEARHGSYWDIGTAEGIYAETIGGLRPEPIRVQGGFALQRVSKEAALRGVSGGGGTQ